MSRHIRIYASVAGLLIAAVILGYVFMPSFSTRTIEIVYPFKGSVFPKDFASPEFWWNDDDSGAESWALMFTFADGSTHAFSTDTPKWKPGRTDWESIKQRSIESDAVVTVTGYQSRLGVKKAVSRSEVTISTSADEVGAPVFFRQVTLPFEFAVNNMETIKWCLGDVSSDDPPRVVLENMPVCGNCHSFSDDGVTLGMDVDYANDKGSFIIVDVAKEMTLSNDEVITWSDFRKEDGVLTFGLLSQLSPDGRFAVSTVKDRSVFVPVDDLEYSQLFFPLKGILALYDRETKKYSAIPGASDNIYVQSNPEWSPDGSEIIFARSEAAELARVGKQVLLTQEQCEEFLEGGRKFKFDLYRVPFNGGKGGEPVPIEGASGNGMSNYFAKYSPDGKWIVFCRAESFMLLQPDSRMYIMPAAGGEPREMTCNTGNMNSWHSWSPNGRWLVFTSKEFTPYTQLFLTHIDENGNDTPPVLLGNFTPTDRAANIPEFLNADPDAIMAMHENFVDYYSFANKGGQLFDEGRYEESEFYLKKSIALRPDFAPAHKNLGYVYTRLDRLDEAEKEWLHALDLDPNDFKIYLNLGSMYYDRGDYDAAEKRFDRVLALNPTNGPAHAGKALIMMADGNRDGARRMLETAVKLDPAFDDGYTRLAAFAIEDKNFAEAETLFRKAYENNNINAIACIGLAKVVALDDARLNEAIKLYREAIRLMPDSFEAHVELGNLYVKSKDAVGAINEFDRALQINPQDRNLRAYVDRLKQMR